MHFYMVAFSLPREGYYMTIHKHGSPAMCKWAESDRTTFMRIREQTRTLYEKGPAELPITRSDLEVLFVEGLTPDAAVGRMLPYYLKCYSANKRRLIYPRVGVNEIEILGPAGTDEEDFGLKLAVIGKSVQTLRFQPWVLQRVSELRGNPFTEEESQTLAGRCDRTLVAVVAAATTPISDEGYAKIVVVPKEFSVRLTRRHSGEFISENPRVWA